MIDASGPPRTRTASSTVAPGVVVASGSDDVRASLELASINRERFDRVGRYVLVRKLGAGAMGLVLLARDPQLHRNVAIKVLYRRALLDDDELHRVRLEAEALARLSHPNVVQIYEAGESHGRAFIAMEYVPGHTLREWMAGGGRSVVEIARMFAAIGAGLHAAHTAGLVHRDFKPDNVLIGTDGRPRIVDFGLARGHQGTDPEPSEGSRHRSGSDPTRSLGLAGTPAYMAPEQHLGKSLDPRSDQYAFCVALYEALDGERPFAGRTTTALLEAKLATTPRHPRGVPMELARAIRRGLSADPEQRFPNMRALIAVLERAVARRHGRRTRALAAGLVSAAALTWSLAEQPPDACEAMQSSIDAAWTPEVRDRLARAFARHGRPGVDVWAELLPRVEGEFDRWRTLGAEACLAARGDPRSRVHEERLVCLRNARTSWSSKFEIAAESGSAPLSALASVIETMPSVEECARIDGTEPRYEQLSEAHAAELARIDALTSVGRYEEGYVVSLELLRRARASGKPSFVAEVLERHAELRYLVGRHDGLLELIEESAFLAESVGNHGVAAESWSAATLRAIDLAADLPKAESYAEHARVALERAGFPEFSVLQHERALAFLRFNQGRFAEAVEHAQRAVDLSSRLFGPNAYEVLMNRQVLSHLLISTGDLETARRLLVDIDAALETRSRTPVDRGSVLATLAEVNQRLLRFDEQLVAARRALEFVEQGLGPEHPIVAHAYSMLGLAYCRTRQFDEALAPAQRGVELLERDAEGSPIALGNAKRVLGRTYWNLERDREAIDMFEQALVLEEQFLGGSHPDLLNSLLLLGTLHLERGEFDRARRYFGRGVALIDDGAEVYPPLAGEILVGQALVELHDRSFETADRLIARASEIYDAMPPEMLGPRAYFYRLALAQAIARRPLSRPLALELARTVYEGDTAPSAPRRERIRERIREWSNGIGERPAWAQPRGR